MQTGFIDYPRLIAKLREIGFDGSLVLEIGAPAAEMPEDLRHARKVLEGYLRATSSNPRRQA
jgi:sugar phosphate isomerase/epimerase